MATTNGTPRIAKAVMEMASGAALTATLHDIVDAARELTGARYGAIGILDSDGLHREFIYSGLSPEEAAMIGELPQGHGLLGEITRRRTVTRTDEIASHPRSFGFPLGHPPMQSFLGVPIVHADTVLGNLYLTDTPGGFTSDDEQHLTTLAAVASLAVEKSALLEEANRRGRRLDASRRVAVALLSDQEPEDALKLVASEARQVLEADAAVLVLPNVGSTWVMEIADGDKHVAGLVGTVMPPGGRTERTVAMQQGMIIQNLSSQPDLITKGLSPFGPAVYAPMIAEGQTMGVLILLRLVDGPPFVSGDVDDAVAFARQAALALELAESRRRREESYLVEQRTEIARDLHDFVVQEIFATGAGLSALVSRSERGQRVLPDDLHLVLEHLDTAVLAVRHAITSLRHPTEPVSLELRLQREIRSAEMQLGFATALGMSPQIATLKLDPEMVDDLAAITREALSNAARHAHASTVTVTVEVTDDLLRIEVMDDGVGIHPGTTRQSGLGTMCERAERHRGSLSVVPAHPGADSPGTRVTVRVPVGPAD